MSKQAQHLNNCNKKVLLQRESQSRKKVIHLKYDIQYYLDYNKPNETNKI